MKRWGLLVLVGFAVLGGTVMSQWHTIHKSLDPYFGYGGDSVQLEVVTTGDTAQVSLLHTLTAVDSFDYLDTFSYQADTAVHQTIKWTSAVQIMNITPTVDTASLYACSIGFAGDTLGIAFDATDTEPVLDSLIDSLVAQLNAVAGLTDSVDFQDSVTYIKAVSLFGQRQFTARWKCEFGITGGTGTIDTASHASLVTVAMVVDSMVAAINADAGLDSFMTAANSGDTSYTITSDDAGVLFYATTLNHADTGGTLAASQANVTSYSASSDTIDLSQYMQGSPIPSALYARFILEASLDTNQGVGDDDSAILWLYTAFEAADGTDEWTVLDSAVCATLPGTLRVAYGRDTVGGSVDYDTLFKEKLYLAYWIRDSASDTTYVCDYTLDIDLKLLEE